MFFCRFKNDFGIHCTQMGYKTQCLPCFLIWWKTLLVGLLLLLTIGGAHGSNRQGSYRPVISGASDRVHISSRDQGAQTKGRIRSNHHHLVRRHLRVRTGHTTVPVLPQGSGDLATVPTAAGINITVATKLVPQFQGFIDDLVKLGYTPRHIGCWAPVGTHVVNSNHYHGGACDFDQTGWGRTSSTMYHIGDLATRWGLRDGCSFRHADCGHIDDGTNIGWKHPGNLIARYIDYDRSPASNRVTASKERSPLILDNFEGGM